MVGTDVGMWTLKGFRYSYSRALVQCHSMSTESCLFLIPNQLKNKNLLTDPRRHPQNFLDLHQPKCRWFAGQRLRPWALNLPQLQCWVLRYRLARQNLLWCSFCPKFWQLGKNLLALVRFSLHSLIIDVDRKIGRSMRATKSSFVLFNYAVSCGAIQEKGLVAVLLVNELCCSNKTKITSLADG